MILFITYSQLRDFIGIVSESCDRKASPMFPEELKRVI
jgi:hypothetical protein